MPHSQPGILPEPSQNALFLILRVRDPANDVSAVAKLVSDVPSLVKKTGSIDRRAKLVCTVGFGFEFWNLLSPAKRPRGFRPFKAIEAEGRQAPATGGDLLCPVAEVF